MPWVRQGGAELIAVQTAYQLQKLGHQIKLAALFVNTDQMGSYASKINYLTPPVIVSRLCLRSKMFLYFVGPFFLLWLIAGQTKWAEVIFPQSLPSYWLTTIIGWLFQKKIIWLCNEPPKRRKLSQVGFTDWLMWFIADSFIDKVLARKIDRIIVYSEGVAKEVEQRYGKKAEVIRLGLDYEFFSGRDDKMIAELKKKNNLAGKFVLLIVGKLHPQKNQRLGLEVLKKVLPVINKAILVLVGDGLDENYLKKEAKEMNLKNRVIFTGFCPPEIVRSWYSVCDLVLSPSVGQTAMVSQSWGFIPFEALCQEKLSVVSLNSGAAEVIKSQKIGFVSPITVEGFTRQVIDYFRNEKKYKRQAVKGKAWVKEFLSWEKFAQGVEKNIKELIKG